MRTMQLVDSSFLIWGEGTSGDGMLAVGKNLCSPVTRGTVYLAGRDKAKLELVAKDMRTALWP